MVCLVRRSSTAGTPRRGTPPPTPRHAGPASQPVNGRLSLNPPSSRLGLVLGLRTVNARVGAKRLSLGVCIADAKAQNRQRNEDHALHRNSPIYRQGEMPGLRRASRWTHPAQMIIWLSELGLMHLVVEWSGVPLSPSQTRPGLPHPMTATRRLATGRVAPRRPRQLGHSQVSPQGEDQQSSDASSPEPRQEQLQESKTEHGTSPVGKCRSGFVLTNGECPEYRAISMKRFTP